MATYSLHVNGQRHDVTCSRETTTLLWVIREHLGLTATKYGCGVGVCGACTIHMDGKPSNACLTQIGEVGAREVVTIEGLHSRIGRALQSAWIEHQVPQCGYCQPGQIMRAAGLLNEAKNPDVPVIKAYMDRNLCRCGTYNRIIKAIRTASANLGEESARATSPK